MNANRITVTQLTPPAGGGALTGIGESFQPNEFTGTATVSIPIPVSPCRGFEPHISLDYSSGAGNGIFGMGFGVSIPAISRKTEKGIPKYDDSDTFLISGADDLVPRLRWDGGRWLPDTVPAWKDEENNERYQIVYYRPRTEGLFARIEKRVRLSDGDIHWRVTTKENVVNVYGQTADARIADPDDPARVFQWLLQASWDAKGNRIRYEYCGAERMLPKEMAEELVPGEVSRALRTAFEETGLRLGPGATMETEQAGQSWHINDDGRSYELSIGPEEAICVRGNWSARRDIQRIKYGHYRDTLGGDGWHFELVFDYGERTLYPLDSISYASQGCAQLRADAFTSYRAGFAIRHERLCGKILLFHRFDGDPFLVHATHLDYKETPYLALLTGIRQVGYRQAGDRYESKAMPTLALDYSESDAPEPISAEFRSLTTTTGVGQKTDLHLPIDEFVDLYGDGLPGILHSDAHAVQYWRPQGNGHFLPPVVPAHFPIERDLASRKYSLLDLGGDGILDLIAESPAGSGFFQSRADGSWDSFRAFPAYPSEAFQKERHSVDVTGDSLADILIFEAERVKVYPSLGKLGFAPAIFQPREEHLPIAGPHAAGEIVRFADMFGDGGSHLVRVRSGQVACWPNLGYGRFGQPVFFQNAPHFDTPLASSRLFLADLDGSGTADLVYACHDHLEIYRNQSGNGFGERELLPLPVAYDNLTQIRFADILGNGTSCLVLTTRQADMRIRHDYYSFTGGEKPHLLIGIDNNRGAMTRIHYAPSTRFFLADLQAGRPWTTRLSFPVQVIESIEVIDQIAQTRLVTRYAYHDGYYDADEREFRGFGHVEHWDAESFAAHESHQVADKVGVGDAASYVAPVHTRSWYHTGAVFAAGQLSTHYRDHFYPGDEMAHELPDTVLEQKFLFNLALPADASDTLTLADLREELLEHFSQKGIVPELDGAALSVVEVGVEWLLASDEWLWAYRLVREGDALAVYEDGWRAQPAATLAEAYRALRGHKIRQEIYSPDGGTSADHPYAVTESNFKVRLVQPQAGQTHAVCFVHPSETLAYHYERNPADPRVEHSFVAEVDAYGHILQRCHVYYPRRSVPGILPEQGQWQAVATVERLTNVDPPGADPAHFYLLGALLEEKSFEIAGLIPSGGGSREQTAPVYLDADDVARRLRQALANEVPHEAATDMAIPSARLLSWQRHAYWHDDDAAYPLTAQALHRSTEEALFSPAQIETLFGQKMADVDLETEAGYHFHDGYWWNPGLIQHYADADGRFLPIRTVDPFGWETTVGFDKFNLLPVLVRDALNNESRAEIDYYVLKAHRISDINNNLSEVLFDPLGMVIATSIYDETSDVPAGDSPLAAYVPRRDVTWQDILDRPAHYLQEATSFFFYDFAPWQAEGQPSRMVHLQREYHVSQLSGEEASRIQIDVTFGDGFDRTLQRKRKAGAGPAFGRKADGRLQIDPKKGLLEIPCDTRWLVSGRTLYNNKGKAVRTYEPFFSADSRYEPDAMLASFGVSHVTQFDPLLRPVRTDSPDGYFSTVHFTPWQDKHFDENDTWPDSPHYNTPETHLLDTQGHVIRVIQQLAGADDPSQLPDDQRLVTTQRWDIQGHPLSATDPRGIVAFEQRFDMDGVLLWERSADAGERWLLHNALGNQLHLWDGRDFRISTSYDKLHRPTEVRVTGDDGQGLVLNQTVEKMIYGEGQPDAEKRNLRGKLLYHYDQAGRVEMASYDLRGSPLTLTRRLRVEYKGEANWPSTGEEDLLQDEAKGFTTTRTYDALARLVREDLPDGNTIRHDYLPEGALVGVVMTEADGKSRQMVSHVRYNARGQRTHLIYGQEVETSFTYDPQTFRLATLKSARTDPTESAESSPTAADAPMLAKSDAAATSPTLQDIVYGYDPVGNITQIQDASHRTIFARQQKVDPVQTYSYDALYRLISATGREHPALTGRESLPVAKGAFKQSRFISLNNSQQLRGYQEFYTYNAGGNLTRIQHLSDHAPASWSRDFAVAKRSNRATLLGDHLAPADVDALFADEGTFDLHGNLKQLAGASNVCWNYRDNIASVTLVHREDKADDGEWYVYDSGGQRIRKVAERQLSDGLLEVVETIYLDGVEIKRVEKRKMGEPPRLTRERRSLHIFDDRRLIAICHRWTVGPEKGKEQIRYQLGNHLGSASLELSEDAEIISYEEYFPYGGTALIAGRDKVEVQRKSYRYSGKERDDSTGLYYYGARYYAPWLGRWMNPDPAGTVDGLNLYAFVGGNPVTMVDQHGLVGGESEASTGHTPSQPHVAATDRPMSARTAVHGLITHSQFPHNPKGYAINDARGFLKRGGHAAVGAVKGTLRKMNANRTLVGRQLAQNNIPGTRTRVAVSRFAESKRNHAAASAVAADPNELSAIRAVGQGVATEMKTQAINYGIDAVAAVTKDVFLATGVAATGASQAVTVVKWGAKGIHKIVNIATSDDRKHRQHFNKAADTEQEKERMLPMLAHNPDMSHAVVQAVANPTTYLSYNGIMPTSAADRPETPFAVRAQRAAPHFPALLHQTGQRSEYRL